MTSLEIPATGSAEVHVLHNGYVGLDGDDGRVGGTVTLIRDGGAVIFVDPGMVADRDDRGFEDVIIPGHGAPLRPASLA